MVDGPGNPVSDFFTQELIEDPYPFYEQLRAEGPAVFIPQLDVWMVGRYDECMEVLRTPEVFHQWDGSELNSSNPEVAEELAEMFGITPEEASGGIFGVADRLGGGMTVDTLVTGNPPEHTRYRYVTNQAWSARRTATDAMPRIREICGDLIDGFDEGSVEYMARFANPLPSLIIAEILGLPEEDWVQFASWTQTGLTLLGGNLGKGEVRPAVESMFNLLGYLGAQIERRKTEPTDDALTALRLAHDKDGRGLEHPELLSIALQLLGAGHETTINGLGNMAWLVLREPGLRDTLLEQPSLIPNAVAETLRIESPVQFLFRKSVEDYELRNTKIPAGSRVAAVFASANRDPAEFPDPEHFDLTRENVRHHVAFGFGIHRCVGEPLSITEMEIALGELLVRLPELRLSDGQGFEHNPHPFLRRLRSLWIDYGVRAPSTPEPARVGG